MCGAAVVSGRVTIRDRVDNAKPIEEGDERGWKKGKGTVFEFLFSFRFYLDSFIVRFYFLCCCFPHFRYSFV